MTAARIRIVESAHEAFFSYRFFSYRVTAPSDHPTA